MNDDEDIFQNMKNNKLGILESTSAIEKAMKPFETHQSLFDKALGITSVSSAIEEAMKPFGMHQSLFDKALGITSVSSAIEEAMKPFGSHQSLFDKALGITSASSAIEEAMKPFRSHQSLFDKALAITSTSSAIEEAMKPFTGQHSLLDKALGFASSSFAIADAMKSFESQSYLTENAMSAMANSTSVSLALGRLQEASIIKHIDSNFLKSLAASLERSNFTAYSEIDEASIESDFQFVTSELSNAPDKNSFIESFNKLPKFFKLILALFFLEIFLPHLNSISANLLTPIVSDYLLKNDQPDRVKVKTIKSLPRKIEGFDTTNFRFITGNNVRLRADPSTNSSVLDEMALGQIVAVHSKNKNWIEVSYEYEDGLFMHGWVFTRYTARFAK